MLTRSSRMISTTSLKSTEDTSECSPEKNGTLCEEHVKRNENAKVEHDDRRSSGSNVKFMTCCHTLFVIKTCNVCLCMLCMLYQLLSVCMLVGKIHSN